MRCALTLVLVLVSDFVSSFVLFLFNFRLSIAEVGGIGRANSPRTANLALCARTAHQGGLVGNTPSFRHPAGAIEQRRPFLVTLLGCSKRVTRPRCENRNAKLKRNRKCQTITHHSHTLIRIIIKWLLFAAAGKESLARQWAKPQEKFKIAVNAKSPLTKRIPPPQSHKIHKGLKI